MDIINFGTPVDKVSSKNIKTCTRMEKSGKQLKTQKNEN